MEIREFYYFFFLVNLKLTVFILCEILGDFVSLIKEILKIPLDFFFVKENESSKKSVNFLI